MTTKSYLLALDGSKESLAAANIACKIAPAQDAKLIALSVVDNQAVWDLLGPGLPGFIGSGPYIAAFETIQKALQSVSETLLTAFEAKAQIGKITTECLINEGDLLRQVLERSKGQDLVVMGRRNNHASTAAQELHSFIRTSLSKRLARVISCPLLIVPSERVWTKARLILSDETYSADVLFRFLSFTDPLALEREIFCIGPEESIVKLIQKVKSIIPHTVKILSHDATDGDEPLNVAADVSATTLLVVTTMQSVEGRETCSGSSIQEFLTAIARIPVLILPPAIANAESNTESNTDKKESEATAIR